MNIKRIVFLLLTGVMCFQFVSPRNNTYAQSNDQGFNLVTSPLPINLSGQPGTVLTADIKVKNGATRTEKFKVNLMKFSAYGEEGKPSIQDREPGDDYFDWVTFSPSVFDAPPNEWVTVKMTIKLPPSAAFGYYYAAVFSRANAPERTSTKENVLVGSTAVLVLVDAKVAGAKRTAEIAAFSADKKFYEFLPSTFTIKVRNSGNVHLIPTGNIFIKKGGKNIATLNVNKAAGNVLPNSNRIFNVAWDDGFPVYTQKQENGQTVFDKAGKPVKNLTWDITKVGKLKFGRYTAQLVMAYDNGERDIPLEATVSFWVVPVRILVIGGLVALFAGVGIWSVVRKSYRKVTKHKGKNEA